MKTFTTSKGAVLELKPISQFKLDSIRASQKTIDPPTYEMEVVGGGKQTVPMDFEIAKNQDRLEEWKAYLAKKAAADAEYSEKFSGLLIWDGLEVNVPDENSQWQKNSEWLGIEISDIPIKRKMQFVYNELLSSPEDMVELIAQIMLVSSVDEEQVQNLRDSFRAGMERKTTQRTTHGERPVESQPDLQLIRGYPLLEQTPK